MQTKTTRRTITISQAIRKQSTRLSLNDQARAVNIDLEGE